MQKGSDIACVSESVTTFSHLKYTVVIRCPFPLTLAIKTGRRGGRRKKTKKKTKEKKPKLVSARLASIPYRNSEDIGRSTFFFSLSFSFRFMEAGHEHLSPSRSCMGVFVCNRFMSMQGEWSACSSMNETWFVFFACWDNPKLTFVFWCSFLSTSIYYFFFSFFFTLRAWVCLFNWYRAVVPNISRLAPPWFSSGFIASPLHTNTRTRIFFGMFHITIRLNIEIDFINKT